jgi:LAO/AO transport system kinase
MRSMPRQDLILIETVGAGSEIDVAEVADVRGRHRPGPATTSGHEAGLIEIADIMVVNKADREGADPLRQLKERSACGHTIASKCRCPDRSDHGGRREALAEAIAEIGSRRLAGRRRRRRPPTT